MDATNFCLNHLFGFFKTVSRKRNAIIVSSVIEIALDYESEDVYSKFLIGLKDAYLIFTLSLLGESFILSVKENTICL